MQLPEEKVPDGSFPKQGEPNIDPKHYNPYYWDPLSFLSFSLSLSLSLSTVSIQPLYNPKFGKPPDLSTPTKDGAADAVQRPESGVHPGCPTFHV